MKTSSRNRSLAVLIFVVSLLSSASAQKPTINEYRVRVVTRDGALFRGTLDDINETYLFIHTGNLAHRWDEVVPLLSIKKVILRRGNNRSTPVVGAVVGGLLTGYLATQSLQRSQPSSPISYGLTLSFAAIGGAAAGLLVGVAIGNVTRRVIRPLDLINPEPSLLRQLEPFSIRYQQDLINRLPSTN